MLEDNIEGNLCDFIKMFSDKRSEDVKRLIKGFILVKFKTLELSLKDIDEESFSIEYYTSINTDEITFEHILYKLKDNDTYEFIYPDNITQIDIYRLTQEVETSKQIPNLKA